MGAWTSVDNSSFSFRELGKLPMAYTPGFCQSHNLMLGRNIFHLASVNLLRKTK